MADQAGIRPLESPEGASTPIGRLAKQLQDSPLLQGRAVTATLSNSTAMQYVTHPLGRAFKGAIVVGQSITTVGIVVERGASSTADATKKVGLRCLALPGAACTVDLWVY